MALGKVICPLLVTVGSPKFGGHFDASVVIAPTLPYVAYVRRMNSPYNYTFPITSPRNPTASRLPAIATSRTVRVWPGSKRVAVPAGMSSR